MNTHYHAVIAAKRHGGIAEDYYELFDFIDSSKSSMADIRHRAILHSSFGIYLCERVFGHTIQNSEGIKIPTRILAEEHIMDDLGFIPTVEHWLGELPIRKWMSGTVKKTKIIPPIRKPETEEVIADGTVAAYRKSLKVKGE